MNFAHDTSEVTLVRGGGGDEGLLLPMNTVSLTDFPCGVVFSCFFSYDRCLNFLFCVHVIFHCRAALFTCCLLGLSSISNRGFLGFFGFLCCCPSCLRSASAEAARNIGSRPFPPQLPHLANTSQDAVNGAQAVILHPVYYEWKILTQAKCR